VAAEADLKCKYARAEMLNKAEVIPEVKKKKD